MSFIAAKSGVAPRVPSIKRNKSKGGRSVSYEPSRAAEGGALESSAPAIAVRQDNRDLIISARFPGMNQEDVSFELQDGAVVIQGSRNGHFGRFYIPLPAAASAYEATSVFRDELLQLSVPLHPVG